MAQQQIVYTAALDLELEQEEKCHKEAITAKCNKRKADDISKDQSKVTEDIATTPKPKVDEKALSLLDQSLNQEDSDEDYTGCDCDDCGKKPKDKVDFEDNWKFCELCSNSVCKDCVLKCEECSEYYCKCVRKDGSKHFCEDCDERACRFVCCHWGVTKVPCGRTVCDDCKTMHRGYECNHCYQAIAGGWAEAGWSD